MEEQHLHEETGEKPQSKNIYQRILAVETAVSYVAKGDIMVNGQYTFVSHDAVTAILRPHLLENGIVYHPTKLEYIQDGNRTMVSLVLRFVNVDDPRDHIDVPSLGFGVDSQDKGSGKAISYAVKYALLKTFGLETGDDPERDLVDYVQKPSRPVEETLKERYPEPKEKKRWK